MDEALIVQIFVQGKDREHGRVATAYPVTRELVLTARHALTSGGASNEIIHADRVEMRWFNLDGGHEEFRGISKEDIAWDDEELDLALVRFPLPAEETLQVTLSDQMPLPRSSWSTVGFPNFGVRDAKKSDPWPLTGTTLPAAKTDGCFELLADLGPKKPELWRGLSGAPVFVGGQIVAVVQKARSQHDIGSDRDQLISISLKRVFKTNEEFCKCVRPNDPKGDYCEKLTDKIADYLAKHKILKSTLCDSLGINGMALSNLCVGFSKALRRKHFLVL